MHHLRLAHQPGLRKSNVLYGWLTQIRTAAAGALAAELAQVDKNATLGVIGTGTQALLQAQVIMSHLKLNEVAIYGRSADKHHGDFGAAVREGVVADDADVYFCDLLAGEKTTADFSGADLSLIDLAGLGVQDLALASLIVDQVFV